MMNRSKLGLIIVVLVAAACGADPEAGSDGLPTEPPPTPSSTTPSQAADALRLITPRAEDGMLDVATLVRCPNGPVFPLSALDSIEPLSGFPEIEAAIAGFLASSEGGLWPQEGWQVLHATADEVFIVAPTTPEGGELQLSFMTIVQEDDEWRWAGSSTGGDCPIQLHTPDHLNRVSWRLDPDVAGPGPDSTTVNVLITEAECVGGIAIGDRLLGPDIVVGPDSVRIAFAAERPPGDAFACPSNPETPFVVELGMPLGDRSVEQGLDTGLDLVDFLRVP